ncbi:SMP-30/gluconolactonase/LRE family protein (plasmid) [Rossellomorea sp. FS2]|uniref:SMP-30/gluconolactonase/LRE family protein n=1 Tax=Rossellomorea sp. FS2 TaxID=3391447 RepID=UPI003A4E4CA6
MNQVRVEIECDALLGESPFWDGEKRVLYWVDLLNNTLYIYDVEKGMNTGIGFEKHVCSVVKAESGGIILALQDGIYSFNFNTGDLNLLVEPGNWPDGNRFNDGKCDPEGRYWIGTMNMDNRRGQGALFRLHQDGLIGMLDSVSISNGLAWDRAEGKMYYIDTPTQEVASFDYNPATGEISNRHKVYSFAEKEGSPDGMTIDSEGNLWVALWGGGKVAKINPSTGRWEDSIHLPVSLVTSCVFGGADHKTLFITTARYGMTEQEIQESPLSGSVFAFEPGVAGTPSSYYKGVE